MFSTKTTMRSYKLGSGLAGFVTVLLVLTAFRLVPANEARTIAVHGGRVSVGNGEAHTYALLRDGRPIELGVALSAGALTGLPAAHEVSRHGGHPAADFVLRLPEVNAPQPFRHVLLNWNPEGHEPDGIYHPPHFDFHFYMVDEHDRELIDPNDPEFAVKAAHYPSPAFVPAGYVSPEPLGFPKMGVHWIDPASAEFVGGAFTKTFIFGTWDGKLIFAEPMVTLAYLKSKPNTTIPIPVPLEVTEPGWYPGTFSVKYDQRTREYRVALGGFVWRDRTAS